MGIGVAVLRGGRSGGLAEWDTGGRWWWRRRGGCVSGAWVKVQLLVRETNTAVVAFYERLGFEVAPRVVMGKWLS